MRVLQLHTHYRQAGGEDAVVEAEASVLRAAGHDVETLRAYNPAQAGSAAVKLLASPWNPRAARLTREAVERARPHVAHVHNTWFALSPSVVDALADCGVPVVVTLHNYRLVCSNAQLLRDGMPCELCVGSHPWHAVRFGCYRDSRLQSIPAAATIALGRRRRGWQRADVLITLTTFALERFVAAGLPPSRFVVKPNFVEDSGNRLTAPSASRTVAFVGRLTPEKGAEELLDAWRRASTGDLELLIVGDGPSEAHLRERAPDGVRFTGRLGHSEVVQLMRGARALIVPSLWYEGQPLVVLEAFAAGLPVVASAIGGLHETVAPLGSDWLVPPRGVGRLVDALERLRNDALVDAGGSRARSLFEQEFSPHRALTKLEEIYALAQQRA